MKMTVLYLKGCGHAMAACTRVALAEPDAGADPDEVSPEVAGLVGDALLVRGFHTNANAYIGTQFSIPAIELATLTIERNEDQLLSPRSFAVVEDERLELPPVAAAPTPELRASDTTTLYVDLGSDVVTEQGIAINVVPVSGTAGKGEFFRRVFVPSTGTAQEVSFRMHAPLKGNYDVLVLMSGRRAAVWQVNVP